MGTGDFNAGDNPAMNKLPIQKMGEERGPDGTLGSNEAFYYYFLCVIKE